MTVRVTLSSLPLQWDSREGWWVLMKKWASIITVIIMSTKCCSLAPPKKAQLRALNWAFLGGAREQHLVLIIITVIILAHFFISTHHPSLESHWSGSELKVTLTVMESAASRTPEWNYQTLLSQHYWVRNWQNLSPYDTSNLYTNITAASLLHLQLESLCLHSWNGTIH